MDDTSKVQKLGNTSFDEVSEQINRITVLNPRDARRNIPRDNMILWIRLQEFNSETKGPLITSQTDGIIDVINHIVDMPTPKISQHIFSATLSK